LTKVIDLFIVIAFFKNKSEFSVAFAGFFFLDFQGCPLNPTWAPEWAR